MEPCSNLATDLDGYAGLVLELIEGQLEADETVGQSEIEARERDLGELDAAGETFSNLTYFLYVAPKLTYFLYVAPKLTYYLNVARNRESGPTGP